MYSVTQVERVPPSKEEDVVGSNPAAMPMPLEIFGSSMKDSFYGSVKSKDAS